MNTDKKGIFTIINDEGKEVECEVLFTFDSDETKKMLALLGSRNIGWDFQKNNTTDEDGSTKVYASVYDPTGNNPALMPIETEKEWLVIENILSSVQSKIDEAAGVNE